MRNQAISYMNEIKVACDTLNTADIALIEIKRMEFAVGYVILIRSFLNNVFKHQVTIIAKEHSLSIEEKCDGLLIYQPKKLKELTPTTQAAFC